MPELPFTLDQLRILKAIAEQGSFKKAADLLFVTQPAVSLQIQNLEKQLNITIFDRGGRKALLTEAGQILLEYCQRILNQCDEACKAVEDLNNLKIIWSVQIGGGNAPIVSGNTLFLIDNRNIVHAMNAKNGKIKWMKQLDTNIEEGFYFKDVKKINFIGPFLVNNKLILFSSNGYLKTIDPLNGKLLKSINFDLLGTEPIFIEDKLIILTSDGDLKVYK